MSDNPPNCNFCHEPIESFPLRLVMSDLGLGFVHDDCLGRAGDHHEFDTLPNDGIARCIGCHDPVDVDDWTLIVMDSGMGFAHQDCLKAGGDGGDRSYRIEGELT